MIIITWFLRIFAILFGLMCTFVALDMFHIWAGGVPDFNQRKHASNFQKHKHPKSRHGSSQSQRQRSQKKCCRWKWQIRRVAGYLFLLGAVLTILGVLLWIPNYGNIHQLLNDHIVAITVGWIGLIFLRGTITISSRSPWLTIIKRPMSGKAFPSILWMTFGLFLVAVGFYGGVCEFQAVSVCMGNNQIVDLIVTLVGFVSGGVAAMGLEALIQSYQAEEPFEPKSFSLLGMGLVFLIASLWIG